MKAFDVEKFNKNGRSHTELYKELEVINFNQLLKNKAKFGEKYNMFNDYNIRNEPQINLPSALTTYETLHSEVKIEKNVVIFQKGMRMMLFCGQCLGLNPVLGIFETDYSKLRFNVCSMRCFYSLLVCVLQALNTILSLYKLVQSTLNITMLVSVYLYGSGCLTVIFFIRVAAKWKDLVKEVQKSTMDEYVNPRIPFKCNIACVVLLSLFSVEYVFHVIAKRAIIADCFPNKDFYRLYVEWTIPWYFEVGIPYQLPYTIIYQFLYIITTSSRFYLDLFAICISFYLTSILERINHKIDFGKEKHMPPEFWLSLREDYTRATRLISAFNDVISSIVFMSFANNLFYMLFQLFNILANGTMSRRGVHLRQCPNFPSGIFGGYENPIYVCFSLAYLFGRFLAVSMIAARVHSASLTTAPALYDLPASVYCHEVERFIEQVHGGNVALSGQFFFVSKEMVLSVAGAIVTYELVLLQFHGEDIIEKV